MNRLIWKTALCAALLCFSSDGLTQCAQTVTWTPPTQYTDGRSVEPGDITTYEIDHGTQSGVYTSTEIVAGTETEVTIPGLECAVNHYFVARACVPVEGCSANSNESVHFVGSAGTITNLVVTWQSSQGVQFLGDAVVYANAGNGSQAVSVPAGATLALIQTSYWDESVNGLSVSLGAPAAVIVDVTDADGPDLVGLWMGSVTVSAGLETITWAWDSDEPVTEGGGIYITFWSGGTVVASGWDRVNGTQDIDVTLPDTGIYVVRAQRWSADGSAPDIQFPGETELYANDVVSGAYDDRVALSYGNHTGTVSMLNENFSSLLVAVIQ